MSGVLILSEAAVGAGLVLFQLVADNATMARAMFVAAHLLNTFLLLAALTLTAWWLSVGVPFAAGRRGRASLIDRLRGAAVAGASGAVAALGDTLFPAQSLADVASRRSLVHVAPPDPAPRLPPGARGRCRRCRRRPVPRRLGRSGPTPNPRGARIVTAIALGQIALGFLNVVMLAPVWLQLAHLLVADALWIGFVLLGAHALTDRAVATARAHAA